MSVQFTDAHWAAFQDHAYRAAEAIDDKMPGWAQWLWMPGKWGPEHLAALEKWGLIEVRREWKDNWVCPTENGWRLFHGSGCSL